MNVRGSVACKEDCDPSVSVTLVRLAGKGYDEKKTVSLAESKEFEFLDVLPGKYRLEVK